MPSLKLSRFINSAITALVLWATAANAEEARTNTWRDQVQLHGFASQTLTWSDQYNYNGHSHNGIGVDMREIGANVSWRPDANWLLSAEVLSRRAGKSDNGSPELDYAVIDRILWSGDNQLGVRLGKIKLPFGFFNTSRDVPHTRSSILMPQSIYLEPIRTVLHSAPGVEAYGDHERDWGDFSWSLTAFQPTEHNKDFEYFLFNRDFPGEFHGRPSWVAQGLLDLGENWRFGASLGEMNFRFRADGVLPPGFFREFTTQAKAGVLSAEYNLESWSFIGEYARYKTRSGNFANLTSVGYYLQANWRFAPGWQGFARYDAFYANDDDRNGTQFAARFGLPNYLAFSEDRTIGLRFDPSQSWTLATELHNVRGTSWLSPQENPIAQQSASRFNLVMFQATYHF